MTTENWIALFFILLAPVIAALWTLRNRFRQQQDSQRALEQAYRALEQEMNQRTQSLRSLNHSLYDVVHQHQQTEVQLEHSQAYLHSIIHSMPSILICVTEEGIITHWNHSAEKHIGKPEDAVLGKYLRDVYPELPIEIDLIRSAIDEQLPKARQNFRQVRDGNIAFYDVHVYPLLSPSEESGLIPEAVIQIDDVTLQVMMENSMVQNEKMLSLGQMAAGMAHEINNPLGAILQNLQNIERRLSPDLEANRQSAESAGTTMAAIERYAADRQIPKLLASIRDAGERSARIVQNMLGFSRKEQHYQPVDMHALLDHCLELTQHRFTLKSERGDMPIRIQKQFADALPQVSCSAAEIQQVILNLLRNASQSFTEEHGRSLPEPMIRLETEHKNGQVEIRVRDNGSGMSEAVRRQVFEPFFTTKAVGSGTGLGLSVSYFIITRHHNGNIRVNSTPGAGSTFIITLPV